MKHKFTLFFATIISLFYFTSCEILNIDPDDGLSTAEVVQGLKRALEIGTDSATNVLSVVDGYYGNPLMKIPLPNEAETIRQQINNLTSQVPDLSLYFNFDNKFEDVVESINRAAEESAKEAKPIFFGAIDSLSIDDGWKILNGENPAQELKSNGFDSIAATHYFQSITQNPLKGIYSPKIDAQLDKDLGLGFSANEAWRSLRNSINTALNAIESNMLTNIAYQNSGYTVNRIQEESIGDYATEKALNGLFIKVGAEEKKIRQNPYDWTVDIIQKVFGSVAEN
ncbi:MAG: DUF4197 domain-containing protein [Bacteroidales bacterium]|jgi:hypothetical protein|nr:DUF4197 domain-containing protein [Bacteroidales bacterium]